MDIVLINIHGPTNEQDEEEKELFYTILEDVYESVKGNIILALGDFSAKIGRERYYRSITGNQSLHELSNDNGTKLVNFAAAKGLVVKSTMFLRKNIYNCILKYTWIASNGVNKNQIYHILINNRFKNSIKNIRTLRGADTDSDHLLVECWMKVKFKKITNCKPMRKNNYNIEKLSEKKICEEYKCKIDNILKGKQDDKESINETLDQLKEIVSGASGEVLDRKKLVSKPWFNKICEESIKRRKLARQRWLDNVNDNEITERYRCHRKENNNIFRCEKRKYVKGILPNIDRIQKQ